MRRGILLLLVCVAVAGAGAAAWLLRDRAARCAAIPLLSADLLPAPDFTQLQESGAAGVPLLPAGWGALAKGVQVGSFTVSGSGHSFQLIGIANALRAPAVAVRPQQRYCVAAQALADSTVSGTRLRAVFAWRDAQGAELAANTGAWQDVRRWAGAGDSGGWSVLRESFVAPAGAAQLLVSFQPASDDRIYLDDIHIRQTPGLGASPAPAAAPAAQVALGPWPDGRRAAVSFSFDWETAMGGLIHSRSDDPNSSQNALDRAARMRAGVTTTLELFQQYDVRATYYANGYNFLLGNESRRQFMGNPTFAWATRKNRWLTDAWASRPWFADDPYSTVQREPDWYFADLLPLLQRAGQDIQSHTFSHMDGGLADPATWQADLSTWREVAAERGIAPARSLAFPWSSSAGMSYASWDALQQAGITSVTRSNWSQAQYDLFGRDHSSGLTAAPRCRPVPGHEQIMACPDFYLTVARAGLARQQIDAAIAADGMIDLWAHTEEVTSPEQIAAWRDVVGYAAQQRDAGAVWVAPLAEIADWQAALAQVQVSQVSQPAQGGPLSFTLTNASQRDLSHLTLQLPFQAQKIELDAMERPLQSPQPHTILVDLSAGQTLEVRVWPA